jgi:hypothetical protein
MPRKKAVRKTVKRKSSPRKKRTAKRKTTRKKGSPTPTNKALYSRVKAEAKRKFDVYPSAYANAWLVRTYKKRGGGYR